MLKTSEKVHNNIMATLAQKSSGYTLTELAHATGLSSSGISLWLKDAPARNVPLRVTGNGTKQSPRVLSLDPDAVVNESTPFIVSPSKTLIHHTVDEERMLADKIVELFDEDPINGVTTSLVMEAQNIFTPERRRHISGFSQMRHVKALVENILKARLKLEPEVKVINAPVDVGAVLNETPLMHLAIVFLQRLPEEMGKVYVQQAQALSEMRACAAEVREMIQKITHTKTSAFVEVTQSLSIKPETPHPRVFIHGLKGSQEIELRKRLINHKINIMRVSSSDSLSKIDVPDSVEFCLVNTKNCSHPQEIQVKSNMPCAARLVKCWGSGRIEEACRRISVGRITVDDLGPLANHF